MRNGDFAVCAALLLMLSVNTLALAQFFSKVQMQNLTGGIEAGALIGQAVLMNNVGIEAKARYTYVFSDDKNSLNSGSDNDSFRTFSVALVFGNLQSALGGRRDRY